MAYQVLARKRRPQTFDEVIGQSAITQTLVNAIRLNRLGHAFLFSGSRGIGKTTTARILAKALNCEHGPTPEPCNACLHCREITAGSSMDVIEIDGASNRGIDEIRELRENVKYSPVSARCKVIIIDEVHMLTREAFNALLKTLEEPPDHVKFILATTEAHKVPVTILSRCQRYDFRRLDVATLTGYLMDICRKESVTVEERTLEVLARMADGGIRDCLSLLDQVISFSGTVIDHRQTMELLGRIDPDLLHDVFRSIASGEGAQALTRFAQYIDGGGDETVFNREMMELTRDLLAVKLHAASHAPLPDDLADAFSFDQLERMFKIMLDLEQTFRYTEYPRLLMDVALVKMSRIQSLTPLSEILGHLKKMSMHPDNPLLTPPDHPAPHVQHRTSHPGTPLRSPATTPASPRKEPPVRTTPAKQPPARPVSSASSPASPASASDTPVTHASTRSTRDETGETAGTTDGVDAQPVKLSPQAISTPHQTAPDDPVARPESDNSSLKSLITALPGSAAPLRGILSFAAVESLDETTLTLIFHPDYRIQFDLLNSYTNRDVLLDTASREAFGKPVDVHYRMGDTGSPLSIREAEIASKHRMRDEQWKAAREHPLVQKSIRMFHGELRDVRAKSRTVPADTWRRRRDGNVEEDSDDQ